LLQPRSSTLKKNLYTNHVIVLKIQDATDALNLNFKLGP
jgi:hypothetical protein